MVSINLAHEFHQRIIQVTENSKLLLKQYDMKQRPERPDGMDNFSNSCQEALQKISESKEQALASCQAIFNPLAAASSQRAIKQVNGWLLLECTKIIAQYHQALVVEKTAITAPAPRYLIETFVAMRERGGPISSLASLVSLIASWLYADSLDETLRQRGEAGNYVACLALAERAYALISESDRSHRAGGVQLCQDDPEWIAAEKTRIRDSFDRVFKQRQGAITVNREKWSIERRTDSKKIQKQLYSIHQQLLSTREMPSIEKAHLLELGFQAKSQIVPIQPMTLTSGLAATGPHLVNGHQETFTVRPVPEGSVTEELVVSRLGIASVARAEADGEKRREAARAKVQALLKARATKLIEERIKNGEVNSPLRLLVIWESLVTPDLLRQLVKGSHSEATMLQDQREAIRYWSGKQIPIQSGANSFTVRCDILLSNHGVNGLARAGIGPIGFCATEQLEDNGPTLAKLRTFWSELQSLTCLKEKEEAFGNHQSAIHRLFADVDALSSHRRAYLQGGNPYELPAKLLLIGHELKGFIACLNPGARHSGWNEQATMYDGVELVANCMSGKDRTGLFVAQCKALIAMKARDGVYPTHADLEAPGSQQDLFVKLYLQMLQEGGGLEITERNTGIKGYKSDLVIYPRNPLWGTPEGKASITHLEGLSFLAKA